jgi:hypothetical protein
MRHGLLTETAALRTERYIQNFGESRQIQKLPAQVGRANFCLPGPEFTAEFHSPKLNAA